MKDHLHRVNIGIAYGCEHIAANVRATFPHIQPVRPQGILILDHTRQIEYRAFQVRICGEQTAQKMAVSSELKFRKFGFFYYCYYPLAEDGMRILLVLLLTAQVASAQSAAEIRRAVTRALPILQKSAGEFVAKRACVSCHHNSLPIVAFHMARERGFTIDPALMRTVEEKTFRQLNDPAALDDVVQASKLNDPTPSESYLLMAAHASGLEPNMVTAAYARRIAGWQRDGHWVTSDFRPPSSSSEFTATATAVRAIRLYMPEELRSQTEASMRAAREWLSSTQPASTEDAAFRLMGLSWADASMDQIAAAERDLLAMQESAGGWPQLSNYPPDAYSTGEALFALREAGVPVTDAAWQKGLKFLISSQARDGTWRVRTRMVSPASVSPAYFPTGFPYKKDEFLSYAGSCWAVMALLAALPEPAGGVEPTAVDTAINTPSWVRTALFGTSGELAALLDAGLDPNSKTAGGTTVLMMAAPDAAKVRLLVMRGADVKARTSAGYDALTIAASFRGTANSIRNLIEAGADAEPPEGIRVRRPPIALASMTGDLENVKLLLAHGAEAGRGLADAVTFGYTDVVRALIQAGANADIAESTGISLLHWAVITGRPAVIADLVKAGAEINGADDFGFTPLMYAATIDFGNAESVKELLKTGADRSVRNYDGRTALQQARRFKHAHLEAPLK